MSATDKEQSQNMSFWGHLDVLRGTLFRIIITLVICAAALFAFMPTIFDQFIMGPARGSFVIYQLFDKIASATGFSDLSNTNLDIELINIKLASQFFLHITTSLWMAAVIAFPVILWLLWGFVSPALYAHEKRGITRAFFFGCCMFYLGVAVGYFLVFPLTLQFLANYQLSSLVPNVISLDSYMDNFLMICLMMGILFELPLVAWLLGKTTLLNRQFFKKYRRHAIVALLSLAAIVTPTGDPITLTVVFLPIYALWELSAFLVPKAVNQTEETDESNQT
ncbi:MAG: twin-arginine translocase subunit TatC [Muribaculaceae bacterium]|nr:twin-arginine translocase subunit TatC [Muribaculaceae bacterium]